ncbi:MAG: NAD(P)H-dependent oxidoreductase [Oscillospiraceae bacterium]
MNTANTREPRALIIFGSPKRDGFTKKLLQKFLDEKGILFSECAFFDCYQEDVAPCNDCGLCKTADHCRNSDLNSFFEVFCSVSEIIIATPIYNSSFPSPLKALLDRSQFCFQARFSKGIKKLIANSKQVHLLLTAGAESDPTDTIVSQIRPIFTVTSCELKTVICQCGTDKIPFIKEKIFEVFNFEK